jgi:ADP-dependent NAD(P)H-hydrate dehydratase / NAD(P)H-hydrate epimerase
MPHRMMPLVTTKEMRRLERAADAAGVTFAAMMEKAGAAVAVEISRSYRVAGSLVLVLVGPGNNGGDGLVAARYLHDLGARVTVYLSREREGDDPNLRLIRERGVAVALVSDDPDGATLVDLTVHAAIVVDALLGTGVSRPVEGPVQLILRCLSDARRQAGYPHDQALVAVDMPSGLNANTGAVDPLTPHADLTVTFGFPKRGHFLFPGADFAGELRIVDIGIAPDLARDILLTVATPESVGEMLPDRPRDANKGSFGKALVVAGCANYTGAAVLASMAAARVGAGLVSLACCASLQPIFASRLLETTFIPLSEDEPGYLGLAASPALLDAIASYTAVLLGPGLGQRPSTVSFVLETIGYLTMPHVIDADALNALSTREGWWREAPAGGVLTPHPGEFARLARLNVPQVQADRLGIATGSAEEWGQVIVLKGANTVVAAPDGHACIIPFANPGLATAGSGDVLAGAIVGLLAQGMAPFPAAVAGAYLHGLAGDLAAREIGPVGMLAGDLVPMLPRSIRSLGARATAERLPMSPEASLSG